MKKELYERCFKADVLALVADPVSNVRMSLAKVIRHHFLNTINGTFVFDIEVNDCVRLLKQDKSNDVVQYVEDIQTFPMNEENDGVVLDMGEYLQRLDNMKKKVEATEVTP